MSTMNQPRSHEDTKVLEPELRFSEFSEDWQFQFLGELAEIKTGRRDTQDRVNGGKYPFFVRSDTVERINEYDFDGEAILTSGDGVGVGKNFHYINGKFNFHQRVYSIRNFKEYVMGKYIYHYFSEKFYGRVIRLSAKNSVDSVRMEMISKMEIPVPEYAEQQKIADFLSSVDKKIEQLTEKHRLLTEYKKGVMQQIFTQQIRFKDDQGNNYPEWEEKKLSALGRIVTGKTPSTADKTLWSGNTPFVTPSDMNGNKYQLNTERTVSTPEQNKTLPVGSIMFTSIASIGKMSLAIQDCITNQQINSLIVKEGINNEFVYYAILKIVPQIKSTQANTTLPIINKTEFSKFKISVPCGEEQQKIANFLTEIDQKIDQAWSILEQTKVFKKGLLQKMFV